MITSSHVHSGVLWFLCCITLTRAWNTKCMNTSNLACSILWLIAFWNVSVMPVERLNGSCHDWHRSPSGIHHSICFCFFVKGCFFFSLSHECFVNNYFDLFPQNFYVACMQPNGQGTASTNGANLKILRYFKILQNKNSTNQTLTNLAFF